MSDTEKKCKACSEPVDNDGVTLSDCPVSPPSECPECYACDCDGSC